MAGNGRLAIEFAEAALAMSLRSKWTERGLANEINLAIYYIASDRWDDARMILHAALQAIDEQHPWLIWLLQHVAALTILESLQSPTDNRFISGLTLLGHVDSDISARGALREPEDLIEYQRVSRALAETVSPHDLATHFSIGAMMSRHQALNLAVRLIGAESAVSG